MLIMDRAENHTHLEFVQVYYNKNIFLFYLLSYTTYLFQSLDVICFKPLKHYYTKAINAEV